MAVVIVKMIFFAVSTLSNLISRLVFTATAYLLVLVIQAFKVPGQAIHGGLEHVADFVKGCFEYLLELVMEVVSSLVSSLFDFLLENISGTAAATGSAIGGLVEQTRTSIDELFKEYFPQILEGFIEMVWTMVMDLWNNYKDAMGYVTENA